MYTACTACIAHALRVYDERRTPEMAGNYVHVPTYVPTGLHETVYTARARTQRGPDRRRIKSCASVRKLRPFGDAVTAVSDTVPPCLIIEPCLHKLELCYSLWYTDSASHMPFVSLLYFPFSCICIFCPFH